MKKVTLVAAVSYGDNGIGVRGKLPWHLPEDLRHFREVTMYKHCIVGYQTYLNMPYLKDRHIHIVPKHGTLSPARFRDFLQDLVSGGIDEVMVIGGARVYAAAMPFATHMIMTRVGIQLPAGTCDAFFPDFDWDEWHISNQVFPQEDPRLSFMYLERLE